MPMVYGYTSLEHDPVCLKQRRQQIFPAFARERVRPEAAALRADPWLLAMTSSGVPLEPDFIVLLVVAPA